MGEDGRIIATDITKTAPALYFADKYYLVPRISDPEYINIILDICRKENVDAIFTCIDPEIMLLARHRADFEKAGVLVFAPMLETAELCFDKYRMYCYLSERGVDTVLFIGLYQSITV